MRYGDEFHSSSYLFLQNLHFVPALGFQSGNIISAVSMATDGGGTVLAGPVNTDIRKRQIIDTCATCQLKP